MANVNQDTTVKILPCDIRAKPERINEIGRHNFIRVMNMIKIEGLPDTIPEREIKKHILQYGYTFLVCDELGEWFSVPTGSFSDIPGPYMDYESVKGHEIHAIINNAYLNLKNKYTIGKDCFFIRNDSLAIGIIPYLSKFATLMAETELSMYLSSIVSRSTYIVTGTDDNDTKTAQVFFDNLEAGKYSALVGEGWDENVKTQPYGGNASSITQLIELRQYLQGTLENHFGINGNFNMKRESIVSSEADLNEEGLSPYPDDMRKNWTEGFDIFNKETGNNVKVSFDSTWEDREKIQEKEITTEENGGDENAEKID